MRDKSPCLGCKHRSPECQSRCEIGKKYFKRQREELDRISAERKKQSDADGFTVSRITGGRGGLET